MKILFQNRNPKLWIGGDMIQLEKTMEALRGLGVECDFANELVDVASYDIVHLFNFSMPWTYYQFLHAKKYHKPVVCSTIYHDTDAFIPFENQQIIADTIEALIFNTEAEIERFNNHLKAPLNKSFVIPNGVDKMWSTVITPARTGYALTVGRISRDKGQLETAKACQRLKLPYVMIGEPQDTGYLAECQSYGAEWFPAVQPQELLGWYAGCSVFILASKSEIMPLTAAEAGGQKKNVVITKNCTWKIPNAVETDSNVNHIKDAINQALSMPPNEILYRYVQEHTWEATAKQIKEVYQWLLNAQTK